MSDLSNGLATLVELSMLVGELKGKVAAQEEEIKRLTEIVKKFEWKESVRP